MDTIHSTMKCCLRKNIKFSYQLSHLVYPNVDRLALIFSKTSPWWLKLKIWECKSLNKLKSNCSSISIWTWGKSWKETKMSKRLTVIPANNICHRITYFTMQEVDKVCYSRFWWSVKRISEVSKENHCVGKKEDWAAHMTRDHGREGNEHIYTDSHLNYIPAGRPTIWAGVLPSFCVTSMDMPILMRSRKQLVLSCQAAWWAAEFPQLSTAVISQSDLIKYSKTCKAVREIWIKSDVLIKYAYLIGA